MIKLTEEQDKILKKYMCSVLHQIENQKPDEAIGILLNELAAWKVWEIKSTEDLNNDQSIAN